VFKNILIKTKIRHLLLAVYVACVVTTVKKGSKICDTTMKRRIYVIFIATNNVIFT
jgi:hypothetical protein